MINLYSFFVQPLLFRLPTEVSHNVALKSLKLLHRIARPFCSDAFCVPKEQMKPVQTMGIEFANAFGLAAGLDKNGDYIDELASLGFGFVEIGTLTPKPQEGNPLPRLFRAPKERAIVNRMGFNNKGVLHAVEQLKKSARQTVIGVNIGKNATTPIDKAVDDYVYCLEQVYEYSDYIVVNISSPNTKGLRDLQNEEHLNHLLSSVRAKQQELFTATKKYVPLVLKIAPDLTEAEIDYIVAITQEHGFDGITSTNTTIDKSSLGDEQLKEEAGGLSGAPLRAQANAVLVRVVQQRGDHLAVIGVGGIDRPEDAKEKLHLGADLVQVYTGFIYNGPSWVKQCVRMLAED